MDTHMGVQAVAHVALYSMHVMDFVLYDYCVPIVCVYVLYVYVLYVHAL